MRLYCLSSRWTPNPRLHIKSTANRLAIGVLIIVSLLFGLNPNEATAQFPNPIPFPTTVQLPTFGVSIDAEGLLKAKRFEDHSGRLFLERARAARRTADPDMFKKSPSRKISLKRLVAAINASLAEGRALDPEILHLAGILRIEYAFCYPDEGDIVIAGPAEGWIDDWAGRSIGIHSGRPTLLLEDLAAAMRAFPPGGKPTTFLGCTIDPDPEGLKRLVAFQRTVPRAVVNRSNEATARSMESGIRKALGMANIRVFGLPSQSHMAHVLVEADYRMKRIAIGLEPPPVRMATFIGATTSASSATLQRWWFTPDYDCVATTADALAMKIEGQGVQLNSEDKAIGTDGRLVDSALKPSRASRAFTQAFTSKYEEIAAASNVYAEMRNMIDLMIAAAFLQQEDWVGRTGIDASVLLEEARFSIETRPTAERTPCVVNVVWKGRRLLAPAGGGVAIQPLEALQQQRINIDQTDAIATSRAASTPAEIDSWWWD